MHLTWDANEYSFRIQNLIVLRKPKTNRKKTKKVEPKVKKAKTKKHHQKHTFLSKRNNQRTTLVYNSKLCKIDFKTNSRTTTTSTKEVIWSRITQLAMANTSIYPHDPDFNKTNQKIEKLQIFKPTNQASKTTIWTSIRCS